MDEQTYELELPKGVSIDSTKARVTKAQAQAIGAQCEKIKKESQRKWRNGDILCMEGTRIVRVRVNGVWPCIEDGASADDTSVGWDIDVYYGNIHDLLQQGPILVGLTDEEATAICQTIDALPGLVTYCERGRIKLAAAINDYRKRQDK